MYQIEWELIFRLLSAEHKLFTLGENKIQYIPMVKIKDFGIIC